MCPPIVAYRRYASETGNHLKKIAEDDYPIRTGDIALFTAEHSVARSDQISKKPAKLVAKTTWSPMELLVGHQVGNIVQFDSTTPAHDNTGAVYAKFFYFMKIR